MKENAKPKLSDATVCEDPKRRREEIQRLLEGMGPEIYKEIGSSTGDFGIGSTFLLKEYEYAYKSHGYACEGTKEWLSIFKMSGGSNHLEEFEKSGVKKSHDYDSIPASEILDLPLDHQTAIKIIENNYIGKTLRVIACTSDGCTKYGGKYYLFAIED